MRREAKPFVSRSGGKGMLPLEHGRSGPIRLLWERQREVVFSCSVGAAELLFGCIYSQYRICPVVGRVADAT